MCFLQSETEKLLSKQLRRDEKRIMREQNKAVEDTEGLLNIQKMRQERLVCLNVFFIIIYVIMFKLIIHMFIILKILFSRRL